MSRIHKKVVIVGDGTVGKTCLLETFANGRFPTEYFPTVFDQKSIEIIDGDTTTVLDLWDTAGQEDYARLRALSYVDTACIVFCFAVNDLDSLENIRRTWWPEVKKHSRKTPPFVLVGSKSDLQKNNKRCVHIIEAKKMKRTIGAAKFVECSAKNNYNVRQVFLAVARTIQKHDNQSCVVL